MVRPKRSKYKDNPYLLVHDEITKKHYVTFMDYLNNEMCIEVAKDVFDVMDRFELEDVSQINKFKRHIEHLELSENELYKRSFNSQESLANRVHKEIEVGRIRQAIERLPITQKRRTKMYYFDGMTYEAIARLEGCTKRAVKFSVDIALKKLREILEK